MRVENVTVCVKHDKAELSADVLSHRLEPSFHLYYRVPSEFASCLSDSGDVFVCALWLLASAWGEDLVIAGRPVSDQLLAALPQIHEILSCWGGNKQRFSLVDVVAPRTSAIIPAGTAGAGAFLSLGVDSTFTLFKSPGIRSAVIVNGFDAWTDGVGPPGRKRALTAATHWT
jgi:hypothetical protein